MPYDPGRIDARRRERQRLEPHRPPPVRGLFGGARAEPEAPSPAGIADLLAPSHTPPEISDPSGSMFSAGLPGRAVEKARRRSAAELAYDIERGRTPELEEPTEERTPISEYPMVAARGAAEMARTIGRGIADVPAVMGELARPGPMARERLGETEAQRRALAGWREASRILAEPLEPGGAYREFIERYQPRGLPAEIVHGLGQAPILIGAGYAGAAAGLPPMLSPGLLGAAAGGGAAAERAGLEKLPKDRELTAKLVGYGLGATEAIPIGNLIRRIDKGTGGLFRRALIESTKNTLEEGVQEAIQQAGEETVFQWAKKNKADIRAILSAGLSGAEVGAPVGALQAFMTTLLVGALPGRRARVVAQLRPTPEAPPEAPAAPPTPEVAPLKVEAPPAVPTPVVAKAVAPELAPGKPKRQVTQAVPVAPPQVTPPEVPRRTAAPPVQPRPLPKVSRLAQGSQAKVITPAQQYDVSYELVDAASVVPSHRSSTFQKHPEYPEGIQERPYHRDRAEQAKVVRQAQKFEPSFVVATTPDAINGPPILASDSNVVLGGNSRAMTIQRVLAADGENARRYREAIKTQAQSIGLDPESVDRMLAEGRIPMLVRRLSGVAATDAKAAAKAARDFNIPLTQAVGQEAAAVSRARALTQAAMDEIDSALTDAGENATLRDALRNAALQRRILGALRREGILTDAEINRYLSPQTGALNEEGVLLVEKTLAGSVIDDADLLAAMPRSVIAKIVRAIPHIGRARLSGAEWDVSDRIKAAARMIVEAERAGMPLEDFAKQQRLFGAEAAPEKVLGVARALQRLTPREFTERMRQFAGEAGRAPRGQAALGFYRPPKPDEAADVLVAEPKQQFLPLVTRDTEIQAAGRPLTPDDAMTEYVRVHAKPGDTAYERGVVEAFAQTFVRPTAEGLKGWRTAPQLAIVDRTGKRHTETAVRVLRFLEEIGYAKRAWDERGKVYYAGADKAVPGWLKTESELGEGVSRRAFLGTAGRAVAGAALIGPRPARALARGAELAPEAAALPPIPTREGHGLLTKIVLSLGENDPIVNEWYEDPWAPWPPLGTRAAGIVASLAETDPDRMLSIATSLGATADQINFLKSLTSTLTAGGQVTLVNVVEQARALETLAQTAGTMQRPPEQPPRAEPAAAPEPAPPPEGVTPAPPAARPAARAPLTAVPPREAAPQMELPWEGYDQIPGERVRPGEPRVVDSSYYKLLLDEVGYLPIRGASIESAHDVAYVFESLKTRPTESSYALYVKEGRPIAAEMIGLGTFTNVNMHPRQIIDTALALGADQVFTAHNHPTGSPLASADDVESNKRFSQAARDAGIVPGGMVIIDGPRLFGYVGPQAMDQEVLELKRGRPAGRVRVLEKRGQRPAEWRGPAELHPADYAGAFLAEMKNSKIPTTMFFFTAATGDIRGSAIFDGHWSELLQKPEVVQNVKKLMAHAQAKFYAAVTNERIGVPPDSIQDLHDQAFGVGYELGDVIHSMKKRKEGMAFLNYRMGARYLDLREVSVRPEGRGEIPAVAEPTGITIPASPDVVTSTPSSHLVYGIDLETMRVENGARARVIKSIIDKALAVEKPGPSEQPVLTLFAGGWGSGKSTTRKAILNPKSDVVADADSIKAQLPEWESEVKRGNGRIAPWLHEESSLISKMIADGAIKQGKNLIYDSAGANLPKLRELARKAKARGYLVRYIYVHARPEQAYQRSLERAKRTGRHVDSRLALYESHKRSATVFNAFIEEPLVDEWRLVDATGEAVAAEAARRIAGRDPEILREPILQEVREKANISLEGLEDERPGQVQEPQAGAQFRGAEPEDRGELRPEERLRRLSGEAAARQEPREGPRQAQRLEAPPRSTSEPRALRSAEGLVPNRPLTRRVLIGPEGRWAEVRFRGQEEQRLYDVGRASLRLKDGLGSRLDAQIAARAEGLGIREEAERVFGAVRERARTGAQQALLPAAGPPPAGGPPAAPPTPPTRVPPGGRESLERARQILARGRADRPKPAQIRAGGPRWLRRARSVFLAEFSALGTAEKAIRRASQQSRAGVGVDRRFELVAGAPGKAEADVYELTRRVVRPAGKQVDRLEEYLLLRRLESRITSDPERKRVASGTDPKTGKTTYWSAEDASGALAALRQELGTRRFDELERIATGPYQEIMDSALRLQVDSGRMKPELYETIKRENPFYAPFGVLKHLEEHDALEGAGRRIATTQDLTKAIRGIDDPDFGLINLLDRSAQQIARSRILAEKNRAMLSLAELAALDKAGGLARKVSADARPRDGYRIVRYYDRGLEAALEVHKDMARAVQGLTRGEAELVEKVWTAGATALRMGATTFNIGFQMVNMPFADLPELALLSRYGVRNPLDALRFPLDVAYALYSSVRGNFGAPNDAYLRFLRSGAVNSTISRNLRPEAWRGPTGSRARRLASTTLDSMAKISNSLEETTKIAGYLRGERIERLRGLSGRERQLRLEEIASEVRNYAGSPDFARRGEMRQLNTLFMFFNARLQGAARDLAVLGGAKGGARMASAWGRLAVAVGLPAIYAWFLNRAPENRDDYDERDEWERENYFLIPMYDAQGRPRYIVSEAGERVRDYRRVPKREVVKVFGNTIEASLDYLAAMDARALARLPEQVFENLSPVGIQGEELTERMESVVASLNPLLRAPIEFGTGRRMFTHAPTVPAGLERVTPEEQYRKGWTPEVFVWLGKKLKMSPLKLEQLVYGFTGGGITQFVPREPPGGRTRLSMLPGLYRFFGSTRLSHRDLYAALREAERAHSTVRKMLSEGRVDEASRYAREHAAEFASRDFLRDMAEGLREFRALARQRRAAELPAPEEGVYFTRGIREAMRSIEAMKRQTSEQRLALQER